MNIWRYLPLSTYFAAQNMAIDEAILAARIDDKVPNTLRLYRWNPSAVSIGRNQTLQTEIYSEAASALGVDMVRRISGGGAVYHDFEGEITYSVVAKASDLDNNTTVAAVADPALIYTKIYGALSDALRLLGVPADYNTGDAKNCPNLTVLGKKISGSSQIISRGVVLQHGTILTALDLPQMFRVLKLKDVDCTQAAEIAKPKLTSIQTELGHKISPSTVANALSQGFKAILKIQLQENQLSPEEKAAAEKLEEKYHSNNWLLNAKLS